MALPLADCRVVDLTDLRGALCARMLADLGAEVAKVTGHQPPVAAASDVAARFRDAGKAALALDLRAETGRAALAALLDRADVVVENLRPPDRRRFGLEPAAVAARHPHLVHVAMADFGLDGPRSAWRLDSLTAQAAGGTLHASGFPELAPCWCPGFLGTDCASVYAVVGAVAALADRRRHGRGQTVEVSVQEAVLSGTNPWSVAMHDYLKINPFLPDHGTRNADGYYWVLPAADGWVRTVIGNDKQWRGFVALLGQPELLMAPEWNDPFHRRMNGDVARLVAGDLLADRTRAELFEQASRVGATLGVIHRPGEFVSHPQARARDVFAESELAGLEGGPEPRPPLRFSATPGRPAALSAGPDFSAWTPRPGPVGPAAEDQERAAAGVHPGPGGTEPLLGGVTVVEFGMAAVGPETGLVLSEFGAEVIKIESSAHLDVLRQAGFGRVNCAFAFNSECRGHKSVTLNLATDEGRRLAFELCSRADVVVENYRGGVLEAMGLGYQAVRAVNPGVVYASSTGYGRAGPLSEMPAYGPLNLGFVGLHLLWNHPGAPYPCGTSLNHPDHVAGKFLAAGVMAALEHRRTSGEGQLVEMAQIDFAAYLRGEVYLESWRDGADPAPAGNSSRSACPHGVFPAAGDDRWVAVAVADDAEFAALCAALGWPRERDLDTLAGRLARAGELEERLAGWTAGRDPDAASAFLQERGVTAAPVMGPLDHLGDEHLRARGALAELHHPEVGDERHAGNPLRMSVTALRQAASAPLLGQHTAEVLGRMLGLSEAEVARLSADGICV